MARWYTRKGAYYLDWWEDGERHRVVCDAADDAEADGLVADLKAKLAIRAPVHLRASIPFGEVLTRFLEDKTAKREKATAETYAKHVRRFRALLPTSLPANQITPEHIDAFLAARLAGVKRLRLKAIGKRTANKERVSLSTVFNWAVRRRLVERNPVQAVDPFAVRTEPSEPCPEPVFRNLIAAWRREAAELPRADFRVVRHLMADVWETMWGTGLRMGEVCALRPEDVDLDAGLLTIRSAANKGPGVLPVLSARVLEILAFRVDLGKPLVFAGADGQSAYRALYAAWGRWLEIHAEHKPAHPHALRHAFSARCEAAGLDPRVTQALMRHRTLAMTGHYSHRGLDALRAALQRLEPPESPARS